MKISYQFSCIFFSPPQKVKSRHRYQVERHYNAVHRAVLVLNNSSCKFPFYFGVVLEDEDVSKHPLGWIYSSRWFLIGVVSRPSFYRIGQAIGHFLQIDVPFL